MNRIVKRLALARSRIYKFWMVDVIYELVFDPLTRLAKGMVRVLHAMGLHFAEGWVYDLLIAIPGYRLYAVITAMSEQIGKHIEGLVRQVQEGNVDPTQSQVLTPAPDTHVMIVGADGARPPGVPDLVWNEYMRHKQESGGAPVSGHVLIAKNPIDPTDPGTVVSSVKLGDE